MLPAPELPAPCAPLPLLFHLPAPVLAFLLPSLEFPGGLGRPRQGSRSPVSIFISGREWILEKKLGLQDFLISRTRAHSFLNGRALCSLYAPLHM